MVIIALADIHADPTHLPQIAEQMAAADMVLLAGDITHFGEWAEADRIITEICKYNPNVLAVPGNCDRPGVNDYLANKGINLDCNRINRAGIPFIGLGGSLPCHGSTPNEMLDNDFTISLTALEKLLPADNKFVLVTHEPPADTAIDLSGGEHIGSPALRSFIEKNPPLLAVSGHTHQAPGIDHIGRTTLVNPGPFKDGGFAHIRLTEKVQSARTIKIQS
ncbi:MAG TPA: hypothetical protein HPP87_06265 [Planctomycetes bacterium]|nr:hypothetical protein [Planctomycetota bacterium]